MNSILSSEDTRQTGVYVIRCLVNGKKYVGSAAMSFQQRWKAHRVSLRAGKHHSRHLQKAWDKYGDVAFEFEIVERTPPDHAVAVEQTFIDYWKSSNPRFGYNVCPSAGSSRGRFPSPKTRAKMSAARKKYKMTDATRKKISDNNRGRKHTQASKDKISSAKRGTVTSEETRAKQSAFQRGRPKSQEHRNKIGSAHRGKKRSPETIAKLLASPRVVSQETRNKISAAHRNRGPMPQSTRDKISAAGRGRKHSPEVLKKIGDGNRGKVITPAMRSAIAESLRGRKASPETKAKQSESQRRRHLDPKIKETHGKALRGRPRPQEVLDKIRLTKLRKQASLWDAMTHVQRRRFLWSHNRKTPQQIIDELTKENDSDTTDV